MRYDQLKRRCQNALQDAIDTEDETAEATMRGIMEALEAGPLKPGDRVDAEGYARVDVTFESRGRVRACWEDESTGVWWVVVEGESTHWMATGNAKLFRKIEKAVHSD